MLQPLTLSLCVSLFYSLVCLFTVLELYLFCVCFSNGLHQSPCFPLAILARSCQNDVENSIINPHSVVVLFLVPWSSLEGKQRMQIEPNLFDLLKMQISIELVLWELSELFINFGSASLLISVNFDGVFSFQRWTKHLVEEKKFFFLSFASIKQDNEKFLFIYLSSLAFIIQVFFVFFSTSLSSFLSPFLSPFLWSWSPGKPSLKGKIGQPLP